MKAALLASFVASASLATIASPAIAEEKDGKGWYGTAGIGFVVPSDPNGDQCVTLSGYEYCADYEFDADSGLSGEIELNKISVKSESKQHIQRQHICE